MLKNFKQRLHKISRRLHHHKITRINLKAEFISYYRQVFKLEVIRKIKLKIQYKYLGMVSVNIETSSICNRQCDFCFNHPRFPHRLQGEMTKVLWKKIMDQLADLKFCGRIGPHFYNEPLLDKRLPELIEYARAVMPFCWLQINSNGDLLNEKIMLELYRHGVNFFFITNYDEEDKPELQLLEADYPALIKVVKNSEMWRTDRGGKIFHKEKILNSPCLRPASQLVVNWEGKVLLCCMDYYAQYSFGDLKQQSLRKIWHNTRFTETKHNIALSRQKGLTICHKCDDPGFIPW